jgi:hypothetical protein
MILISCSSYNPQSSVPIDIGEAKTTLEEDGRIRFRLKKLC